MFKKIASNTFSQILSKFLTAFISIFLIGILTKYLSTEMYWQYNKIYNYLSFFAFFADLWLYTIVVREISKDTSQAHRIIWNTMTLRLILWIGVIFLALLIALFLPWYNTYLSIISIFIVSIFTVFSLLNSSVLSLMQSFMKIEKSIIWVVVWKIVNLLWILIVVFFLYPKMVTQDFDMAFLAILWAGLLWWIVNYLLNLYYARKIVKIQFLFDWQYMKHLFKISLPYGIALFLSVVYFKVDIILLSLIEWTKSDTSIALYSLPMKIIEVLMVIGWFFLNSILPLLSHAFKEDNKINIVKIAASSFRVLFTFSLFVFCYGILYGKEILSLVATPEYLDHFKYQYTSLDAFYIVLWVVVFYFLSALFNYIFIASKHEPILLKINIFITLFNLIGNIIFIPKYSFIWAAYVTLSSQILLMCLWFYFSRKIIQFPFHILKNIFLLIGGSIFTYVVFIYKEYFIFGGNFLTLFIGWIILTIFYGVLLFIIYFSEIREKYRID